MAKSDQAEREATGWGEGAEALKSQAEMPKLGELRGRGHKQWL